MSEMGNFERNSSWTILLSPFAFPQKILHYIYVIILFIYHMPLPFFLIRAFVLPLLPQNMLDYVNG